MKWALSAAITLLIILAIFEPSYGWRVRELLSPDETMVSVDDPSLAAQNEALKAQLATLDVVSSQLPQTTTNDIRAMVYSRYPLNFRNELLLNAGSAQGVATGSAVIFQGIMIGTVQTVWPHEALAETIFDSTLKMPVRIGDHGYDGLLSGGSYPSVGSISKDAALQSGDIIYSASAGIPYGLPIGIVSATSTSGDNLFQTASVNFAYDINTIQTVLITQ